MTKRRIKAYSFLLLVVVMWGVAGPIIKYTLKGIDPLPFLTYRLLISAVISFVFFCIKRHHLKTVFSRHWKLILIYGLLSVPLALGALFLGLDQATVLDLTIIGAVLPLIVTLGGGYFFKEHITKKERVGIAIVLLGVLINDFYPLFADGKAHFSGNLFLLLYLVFDSSSILFAKKAGRDKISSSLLTNAAFIIGFLIFIPITAYSTGLNNFAFQIINLPFTYHLGVWYMAIISGTLAYFLYIRAQRSIEVSEAVLFNYLQPIVAIPLAIFWLNESLTFSFVIGALIIAIGVVIAEYKKVG